MPMATTFGRIMTYHVLLLSIKSDDHVVLSDHVTNSNHCISTTTMPMATKLGRVEMYNEELPAIKSKVSLIT